LKEQKHTATIYAGVYG